MVSTMGLTAGATKKPVGSDARRPLFFARDFGFKVRLRLHQIEQMGQEREADGARHDRHFIRHMRDIIGGLDFLRSEGRKGPGCG